MRLIVGLGNPGTQYARTRHNVGWLVLDELGRRWGGAAWRKEKDAELAEIRVGAAPGTKVLLVRPLTFMNASGKAVAPLVSFYKLEPDAVLAVQDDLDSPFGLLKFRPGGRHGGQNGIRDLIRVLGTEAFPRLKIGISRPPAGWDPADWVLSRWRDEEAGTLAELIRLGANAAEVWAQQGLKEGQAQFNGTDLRPKPEPVKVEQVQAEPEQPGTVRAVSEGS
ncbi:aminoacyl-tRNA hydrolase [Deinococcus oregonensis]|uniref:Peptidyl-tRNA hydrolase n=1 Tax=Deinococcus oregonensis TaxID=1805970 RepID=A0ABV6AT95_9DEIO